MATMQDICDRARIPLNDAAKERYSDATLLEYAKDGLRESAVLRPDLWSVIGPITLLAGVEQVLPAGGFFLIRLLENSEGTQMTEADYHTFAAYRREWRNDTAGVPVTWMPVPEKGPNEKFFVHPPAVAGDQVSANYVKCDVELLLLGSVVPLDEFYHPALQFYVTARAEAVDDQHTIAGRDDKLRAQYAAMLGIGAKTEEVSS